MTDLGARLRRVARIASSPGQGDHADLPRPAPTVLVDRDGVLNVNRAGYVKSWAEFAFLPGALDALALLARHGATVVVVTNQSIVNRGLVSRPELDRLHHRMLAEVSRRGGRISAVFACPHRPDETCGCRKPRPGLLRAAAEQLGFSLANALLVGDHETDLEAARRAGGMVSRVDVAG